VALQCDAGSADEINYDLPSHLSGGGLGLAQLLLQFRPHRDGRESLHSYGADVAEVIPVAVQMWLG
jgi:hypothetical protein